MKKPFEILVLFLLFTTLTLSLISCDLMGGFGDNSGSGDNTDNGGNLPDSGESQNPVCAHAPGEAVKEDEIPATCLEGGSYKLVTYCTDCGEKLETSDVTLESRGHTPLYPVIENEIPATCYSGGTYDVVSYCADCGAEFYRIQGSQEKLGHSWSETECTLCHEPTNASIGLAYELSEGGDYYIVTGIGSCQLCDIVIPPVHDGLPVKEIGKGAFKSYGHITSIKMFSGIEVIGDEAFRSVYRSTYINIPDTVTTIGDYAFYACQMIGEIILPDSVTTLGEHAFDDCMRATKLIIGSGITEIPDYAFYRCINVEELILGENIKSIGKSAFSSFHKIIELKLPEGLEYLGQYAFSSCSSLTFLHLPDSLRQIDDNVFTLCSNLVKVTVGKNLERVSMNAFGLCQKLVEIYNRSSLTFEIGGFTHSYLSTRALNIYTDEVGQSNLYTTEDGFLFYSTDTECYLVAYLGNDSTVILPEVEGGRTYQIYKDAFCDWDSTKTVVIPDCVDEIMYRAFYHIDHLSEVYIPKSVKKIADMAFGDSGTLFAINYYYELDESAWSEIEIGNDVFTSKAIFNYNTPYEEK